MEDRQPCQTSVDVIAHIILIPVLIILALCIFVVLLPAVAYSILYYFIAVRNYPVLTGEEDVSEAHYVLHTNVLGATWNASAKNIFHSCCCLPVRAAHTFHSTDVMNYWQGLITMLCCPFCTLCWAHGATDLHQKLGGEERNKCELCICGISVCCCPACVVAKDAEALDRITEGMLMPEPQPVRMDVQGPLMKGSDEEIGEGCRGA